MVSGEASLLERIELGMERAGVLDAEVCATERRLGLARFSNNVLDQHVDLHEVEVTVRVAEGQRVAMARGVSSDPDAVAELLRRAQSLLPHVPPLEGFPGFAPHQPVAASPPLPAATERADASDRARQLAKHLKAAEAQGQRLAGTLECRVEVRAVISSAGQRCEGHRGWSSVRIFAMGPDGQSGFGHAVARDPSELDVESAAARAATRCGMATAPRSLPPGTYDVLLEPPAVAELLEWLAMTGFSAREVLDGTSFLSGRQGERLSGPEVTLADDPLWAAEAGFAFPFDHEGTPGRRVEVVQAGLGGEPLTDRRLAARLGVASSGHAELGEDEVSAAPRALRMEPGNRSTSELLAGLHEGLLVSRLHYVNGLLETRRTRMTGTTRDGTFWVEGGEIRHAVRNLRFTDEVLAAFGRAEVGDQLEAVPTWWQDGGVLHCPALLVRGLRFTGGAQ